MCTPRRFRVLGCVVALAAVTGFSLPAANPGGEKAATKKAAVEKKQVKKAKETKKTQAPPQGKIERAQELLSQMREDVEKFQYERLFLRPGVKPTGGLVEFPADKFAKRLDEIELIAKQCRRQMQGRQAAARAYYEKIDAPQMAAFEACTEGMEEVADLLHDLRSSAMKIRTSGGEKGARYILELNRLERTIAKVMALISVCQRNMNRAEMVCIQFESTPPKKKTPEKVTW